MNKAELRKIVC